ncbi:MAG: SDR family oxidoreductase [Halioglobus sp.]
MKLTRRKITQFGLLGLGGLGTLPSFAVGAPAAQPALKILVLGGTGFLGPHLVAHALSRGHKLTLFNRGKTGGTPFPEAESLVGSRAGKLENLKGRTWDVVIDTSGFAPPHVRKSTQLLAPNVGHYIYMSSTAVYPNFAQPGMDESAPVLDPDDKDLDVFQRYGANKRKCEQIVANAFPEKSTAVRSDTIVGPGDHKHFRYTYWVRRATQPGTILGPGNPDDFVQFIDVRDLAEWLVHCAENAVSGIYNATISPASYTMQGLIQDCQKVAATNAPVEWVDSDFLLAAEARGIPFWSANRGQSPGVGQLSNEAAKSQGLKLRSRLTTAQDTHAWYQQLPAETQAFQSALSLEREQELLAAWKKKSMQAA